MTVAESLRAWLRGYDAGMEEVALEQLGVDPEALGLFRGSERQTTIFADASMDVLEHYDFFLRFPAQTEDLRADGMDRMEGLERWIMACNLRRDLPALDNGRTCFMVKTSGGSSMIEQTDAESVYHITLAIEYFEEAMA